MMKTVLILLATIVFVPLGLTEATSAAEVGIHEKILRFGTTMLIISN